VENVSEHQELQEESVGRGETVSYSSTENGRNASNFRRRKKCSQTEEAKGGI
jgi:hypothetical protein